MKSFKAATVDEYIAHQDEAFQPMLNQIRALIRANAPKAEEVISYQIPCYKLNGMLVGFGTHKKGCSFYTMSTTILKEYADSLEGFDFAGSTLHLPLTKKIPVTALKKIIKQRMYMNEIKAMIKKNKKPK